MKVTGFTQSLYADSATVMCFRWKWAAKNQNLFGEKPTAWNFRLWKLQNIRSFGTPWSLEQEKCH